MRKTISLAVWTLISGVATSSAVAQQAASTAAGTASKVELWGIVDAAVRHTNNEGESHSGLTKMIGGGMSQSRWGINVEEDLGGGTKALVYTEHRFNSDTGERDENAPFFQLAYVGLQGPYGRLTMGRQWNVLFDVVSSTYASFPYSPYMDAYKPELGMAAGARSSNTLKYTLATPDRTWVGTLQYAFAEGNTNTTSLENAMTYKASSMLGVPAGTPINASPALTAGAQQLVGMVRNATPDSALGKEFKPYVEPVALGAIKNFGGFLRYSKDGISLGAGYLKTYLPAGTKLDAWTFGGSYRKDKLYINVGYGQNKIKDREAFSGSTVGDLARYEARRLVDQTVINGFWQGQTNGGFQAGDADKRQMYKIGFGYQVTPRINAGLHYYHAKQSGSASGASNGKADFMVALANYAFSKRTDAYFGVDHTKVSGGTAMYMDATSKARTRTGFTLGLRHLF